MSTGHSPKTLVFLAASSLLAGCAEPNSFLARRTTVGTLKTSLSHVEFENQQLRSKVASLESENRDIENRLVREESVNGDLSARLDNARNLLSDRGFDPGGASGSANRDEPAASRALPAGRSNRTPRKPPFARIPGRIDAAPSSDGFDDEFNRPSIPNTDTFGPQSWRDDDAQWLPIAQTSNGPASKVR